MIAEFFSAAIIGFVVGVCLGAGIGLGFWVFYRAGLIVINRTPKADKED